jgi:hypothetical protein
MYDITFLTTKLLRKTLAIINNAIKIKTQKRKKTQLTNNVFHPNPENEKKIPATTQ